MSYVYVAVIIEVFDKYTHNFDLGIYDSYSKAKNEVTEYIARKYINGTLGDKCLIPSVAKYEFNGGIVDEWVAKDLYDNNGERR